MEQKIVYIYIFM